MLFTSFTTAKNVKANSASRIVLKSIRRSMLMVLAVTLMISGVPVGSAFADTAPSTGTVSTMSADPLPTVQIEAAGVVNAQVVVGNTVYATGSFKTARPAGAAEGVGAVTRNNLLAYNITTGELVTSFNHSLNGEGKAIAASPDGTKLYVGGKFTTVDGVAHPRLVAINLTNDTLVSTFTKGTSSTVATIVATNTVVYAGGDFGKDNTGTKTRAHLIAFSPTGTLLSWAPNANGLVHAMTLTKDGTKLIVGGNFTTINGKSFHGTAALNPKTGAPFAWASSNAKFKIRNDNESASITSLSTDGTYIYLSGFNYGAGKSGGFEGTAALNQKTGAIVWANDCHGDTYSAFPVNGVLYSTGHAHDCESIGAFPETFPKSFHAALASTTVPSGTNVMIPANAGHYQSFAGVPKSTQLHWYPDIAKGSATGLSQAAWSVSGNSNYVVFGGEFPSVNGVKQQGLVRFGKSTVATNKSGPVAYSGSVVSTSPVASDGTALVTWPSTYDRDNQTLTYSLYRDSATTPITSIKRGTHFWYKPTMTFKDTNLVANSTHTYKVVVTDAYGNATTGHSLPAAGCHIKGGTINTLCAGDKLVAGQSIYAFDGKHRLTMLASGTLVLYNSKNVATWSVKSGNTYAYVLMMTNGNLAIYAPNGKTALWNAQTAGMGADHLTLKTNGNLALYTPAQKAVWATGTNGK